MRELIKRMLANVAYALEQSEPMARENIHGSTLEAFLGALAAVRAAEALFVQDRAEAIRQWERVGECLVKIGWRETGAEDE